MKDEKICARCKLSFPRNPELGFYSPRRREDPESGIQPYCVSCTKVNGKAWGTKNIGKKASNARAWYAQNISRYRETSRARQLSLREYWSTRDPFDGTPKRCPAGCGCGRTLGRTKENFVRSGCEPDGLYVLCNVCSAARASRRRAGTSFTASEWLSRLEQFGWKCAYCGVKCAKYTVDHIEPLCRGGGGTIKNIVPSCTACNLSKGSKEPVAWITNKFGVDHPVLRLLRQPDERLWWCRARR